MFQTSLEKKPASLRRVASLPGVGVMSGVPKLRCSYSANTPRIDDGHLIMIKPNGCSKIAQVLCQNLYIPDSKLSFIEVDKKETLPLPDAEKGLFCCIKTIPRNQFRRNEPIL